MTNLSALRASLTAALPRSAEVRGVLPDALLPEYAEPDLRQQYDATKMSAVDMANWVVAEAARRGQVTLERRPGAASRVRGPDLGDGKPNPKPRYCIPNNRSGFEMWLRNYGIRRQDKLDYEWRRYEDLSRDPMLAQFLSEPARLFYMVMADRKPNEEVAL